MRCAEPECGVAVQCWECWTASERQDESAYARHGIRRDSYRWFVEDIRELDHAEVIDGP